MYFYYTVAEYYVFFKKTLYILVPGSAAISFFV